MRIPLPLVSSDRPYEYVYATRSRRTGGISLGLDLTPSAVCNYACAYCRVEGLKRGEGPDVDIVQLTSELARGLAWAEAPTGEGVEASDRVVSVGISGRGEPTNVFNFRESMEALGEAWRASAPAEGTALMLLTNGSRLNEKKVRAGLAVLAELGGEIWFKLDSATREGQKRVNGADLLLRQMRNNLRVAVETAPTWIQTCLFMDGGAPPSIGEQDAYVSFLDNQIKAGLKLAGVQLHGLNDPSAQPGGESLGSADAAVFENWAERISQLGLEVVSRP